MSRSVRLDVVSDIVCPWCAIGLAALLEAIGRLPDDVAVELIFHPFQLNPGLPPEGEAIADNLLRKYGAGPEQASAGAGRIRAAAAEAGVDMSGRTGRLFDTFDAHRLLSWAKDEGTQLPLKKALLQTYFTRGENVSDHDVLAAAAGRAGLDANAAREVLASGRYADEVREGEAYWRGEGVLSVPTIILDREFVISGAQSPDRLEKALHRRAAASA